MSLLMEALRKAEEDKRRAAAGDSVEGAPRARAALGFDPGRDADRTVTLSASTLELVDLEPPARAAEPGTDTTAESAGAAIPIDHEATLPSERSVLDSLQAYFDESQSLGAMRGNITAPTLAPGAAAADAIAMDTGLGTPVTANTVFSASRAPASARAVSLVIGALIVLTVLLGAGGAYYMLRTPVPRVMPPLARGIDVAPAPAINVEPQAPVATARPAAPSAPAPAPVAARVTEPVATPAPIATPAPSARTAPAAPPVPPQSKPAGPQAAPGIAASLATPALGPGYRELRITRGRGTATMNEKLGNAYAALQSGRRDEAEALYGAVLAADAGNRDAMLGLAAIAQQRGDSAQAYRRYREVLVAHPGDAVAAAAVFALQGYGGPDVSEADLKLLIERDPQPAYLHYVLGNHYARQQRWADAERSYFEAHTRASGNPDYALNLAVSLDQLGAHAEALKYYRAAIERSDSGAASFNTAPVLDRIAALAAQASP